MEEEVPFCKICLETKPKLISACKCSGTMKWVHKECLNQWRGQFPETHEYNDKCRDCQSLYKYSYKPKKMLLFKYQCLKTVSMCIAFFSMILSLVCSSGIEINNSENFISYCNFQVVPCILINTGIASFAFTVKKSFLYKICSMTFSLLLSLIFSFICIILDPSSMIIALVISIESFATCKEINILSENIEWIEIHAEIEDDV